MGVWLKPMFMGRVSFKGLSHPTLSPPHAPLMLPSASPSESMEPSGDDINDLSSSMPCLVVWVPCTRVRVMRGGVMRVGLGAENHGSPIVL